MCLAIPAKIVGEPNDNAMAEVDILGVKRHVCLMMTPTAQVDDYVLVHAGFAIQVIDEEFAQESLAMLRQMGIRTADELAAEAEADAAEAAAS
ncbi:MAG: HypC/HybG/HupF family hydrogenase formation chaperone [Coriobacteriia bacterium]|nr:HypC/HybG/HupF family hydrogenase formation chaperone [Coriobacteriia bacterium]